MQEISDTEIVDTETYVEATLTYFFWLPAGKDEFGFALAADAPLNCTAFYRTRLEDTITEHLNRQAGRLRDKASKLAGMAIAGSLKSQDAELGLRKVQYQFEYQPNCPELTPLVKAGPISGTAVILSNGLYLWAFNICYRRDTADKVIREALGRFLQDDFVERHIRQLFDFGWTSIATTGRLYGEGADDQRLKDYNGILTYYQLDLLYNGLFDASSHPHIFIEDLKLPEDVREAYTVGALIRSLSLYGFKQRYAPLFDFLKDYSLRGNPPAKAYLDGEVDLVALKPELAVWTAREHLLSRLSFAAMEQFLRIAVSFGLVHYKTGLDHCRGELVSQSLSARQNRSSWELRRPSLYYRPLILPELEAYHALLAGKLPVFLFLENLVEGLSEVSRPLLEPQKDDPGGVEWIYSSSTLQESVTQFSRQVDAIKTDLTAIEKNLSAVRDDLMLAELTESRKLSEIEAEKPRDTAVSKGSEVILKGSEWGQIGIRLALLGLFLGILEVYSNLDLTDRLISGQFFPPGSAIWERAVMLFHWPVVIGALFTSFLYLQHRLGRLTNDGNEGEASGNEENGQGIEKQSSHIFDYSFLRESLDINAETILGNLRESMVDIEDTLEGRRRPCVTYSTFRETLSSGIERVKYSMESSMSSKGTSYILHFEIDSQLGGKNERLRDVRLVVRMPSTLAIPIAENAKDVIGDCVRRLALSQKSEDEVREFFRERFGWQWPRSQT